MYVLAVRHAESEGNAGRTADPDSPLTDAGRRQAERIAARLAGAGLVAVYSSPYCRAIQTADPLAERLNLPIRLRGELCEAHLGPAPGPAGFSLPTPDELHRRHPRATADPDLAASVPWPPLHESLDDVIARCRRMAAHLPARWPGENDAVALFGHGLPIARLIEAWLTDAPGPSFRFVIVNAAISVLREAGGVRSLLALNDLQHLVGGPRFADVWTSSDRNQVW